MAENDVFTFERRPREENKQKIKACKKKILVMKLSLTIILSAFLLEREEMILGAALASSYVKSFQSYLITGCVCH